MDNPPCPRDIRGLVEANNNLKIKLKFYVYLRVAETEALVYIYLSIRKTTLMQSRLVAKLATYYASLAK